MMIDESKDGLKGLHNLAQGKRSGALGLESRHKNRPREAAHKREKPISDEQDDLVFPGISAFRFPACGWQASEGNYSLCLAYARGRFFFYILYPGRRFGSFLPKLCPGL